MVFLSLLFLEPGHPLKYDIDYIFKHPKTKVKKIVGKALDQTPDVGGVDNLIKRMRNIILHNKSV